MLVKRFLIEKDGTEKHDRNNQENQHSQQMGRYIGKRNFLHSENGFNLAINELTANR
jgi:hypothetical protein